MKRRAVRLQYAPVFAAVLMLGGCASTKPLVYSDPAFAPVLAPEPSTEAAPATGAIFTTASFSNPYGSQKAGRVGDVLTVQLVENTSAQKAASTEASKSSSVDGGASLLFGGTGAGFLGIEAENDQEFKGDGKSSINNRVQGNISVTVAQVLPNGNLMIRGEKLLTINQGTEFVRLSGVIRPQDVGPDNSVPSNRIANARIVYGSGGAIADANQMGWLSRFFNSPVWPF